MKESAKTIAKNFESWRFAAKAFIHTLKFPTRRRLLTVAATTPQGQINGMTIVELLAIVNLTSGTYERVFLTAEDKNLVAWAEPNVPSTPLELR